MEFVGANLFARNCLNVRMNSHPHLLLFLGSGLGYYTRQHGIARHSFVSIPFHSGLGYYLLRSVKVNELERLNPFSFRAGVLPKGITEQDEGTESQSLFIQGWGTTNFCCWY